MIFECDRILRIGYIPIILYQKLYLNTLSGGFYGKNFRSAL